MLEEAKVFAGRKRAGSGNKVYRHPNKSTTLQKDALTIGRDLWFTEEQPFWRVSEPGVLFLTRFFCCVGFLLPTSTLERRSL